MRFNLMLTSNYELHLATSCQQKVASVFTLNTVVATGFPRPNNQPIEKSAQLGASVLRSSSELNQSFEADLFQVLNVELLSENAGKTNFFYHDGVK